jgi:catechol 2,3-dioxygenase-like lactoylglutathione lyase family enzyme
VGGRLCSPVLSDPAATVPPMTSIARLSAVALDCPDPRGLAAFYTDLTGWSVDPEHDDGKDWVQLRPDGTAVALAFQRAPGYRPPVWPSDEHPQQLHLDFDVPDLDEGERRVLEIGARKAEFQPGETFRVFLDPVGHPFCLVLPY